jgi:hypothetical protein
MTTIDVDDLNKVMGGCGCGQMQQPQQPQQPAADPAAGASQPAAGAGASPSPSPGGASPAAGGCNWMSMLQSLLPCLQNLLGGATPPAAGQQPQT